MNQNLERAQRVAEEPTDATSVKALLNPQKLSGGSLPRSIFSFSEFATSDLVLKTSIDRGVCAKRDRRIRAQVIEPRGKVCPSDSAATRVWTENQ
jgi:hypothetical protein